MDRSSGFMTGAYRALLKRNSVYVAFIFVGALAGERVRFIRAIVRASEQ